jgi:hypothetical protein
MALTATPLHNALNPLMAGIHPSMSYHDELAILL